MARKVSPSAISKLRKQEEAQKEKFRARKAKLEEKLRFAVPENLSIWLMAAGNSLFHDIFESGKATWAGWNDGDDPAIYGFTDLKEFASRFDGLRTAWNGVIQLRIKWTKNYKIEITFKAI
jgi:hypothetical protein